MSRSSRSQRARLALHLLAIRNDGKELAGSIGNRILRHFALVFDYRQRRLVLAPYDRSPVPRQAGNRAGFGWGCRDGRCKVLYVIPGSPAAAAQVREGDIILSLNGIAGRPAVSDLVIRRAVEGPLGTELRLSLGDSEGVRDASIVLRDLY